MSTQTTQPMIVVGVDESPPSKDALRWAARYASCPGRGCTPLIAWHLPEIYGYTPRGFESDARQTVTQAINDALGPGARNKLTLHLVEAHPAAALIEMCRDAQMLVVGSHRHGPSPGCCSARSASTASSTPAAPSSWSGNRKSPGLPASAGHGGTGACAAPG